jgi:uncharacterized protein YidB (DUF937 family)
MDMKKLVATVALAGAITVGTAGAAFAADSAGTAPTDPSAPSGQAAKRHPGVRMELRRAGAKVVADTLGVKVTDLRAALKSGQTITQYATSLGKDPKTVSDALVNAANAKIDQLVADGKVTPDKAATIKGKVPARVDKIMNHQFGHPAA